MAQDRLTVDLGETHDVEAGKTQEYYGASVDGTLDVDGTLRLVDNPEINQYDQDPQPGTSPINLPLDIDIQNMQIGNALFITLFLGLLGGMAGLLKNYLALALTGLALFALIASGLLGIGLEIFWSIAAATALVLIAGAIVRWST